MTHDVAVLGVAPSGCRRAHSVAHATFLAGNPVSGRWPSLKYPEYAHLSDADLEALAAELDAIRCDIEASRGAKDRAYIMRAIAFQRCLEIAARLIIARSKGKFGWAVGTAALAAAKCIENMELGHNISHGQWDWMNDPEIHSNTWEWDMAGLTSQWRYSHNYRHHVFTNVVGVDDDLGFGVLRVTRDQEWRPRAFVAAVARGAARRLAFEWGVALHGLYVGARARDTPTPAEPPTNRRCIRKMARQAGKDYVLFPALSRRRWRRTLGANVVANGLRNGWAYIVIVCGHFMDGAEKFTPSVLEDETKPEWYLRQMLGTANFRAGTGAGVHDAEISATRSNTTSSLICRSNRYPRDRRAGARFVRHLRPAVHDRSVASPVPAHRAHNLQVGAAGPVSFRSPPTTHQRRRPRRGSGMRRNDHTLQPSATTCGGADWRQQYSTTGTYACPEPF